MASEQHDPLKQIQDREKEIMGTIQTLQAMEATLPRSEKGRECLDMVDILKDHGFARNEIKEAITVFWQGSLFPCQKM